jgi:hypothetical protein
MSFEPEVQHNKYEVASSSLVAELGKVSPVELLRNLHDEIETKFPKFDAKLTRKEEFYYEALYAQREELRAAIAVLYAKSGDWKKFQEELDSCFSKGLICAVILESFPFAEKQYEEAGRSEGLATLVAASANTLKTCQESWPGNGHAVVSYCLEYLRLTDRSEVNAVTIFLDSLQKQFDPAVGSSLSTISYILTGEAFDDQLEEGDSTSNQNIIEEQFLDYETPHPSLLAANISGVFGTVEQFDDYCPIEVIDARQSLVDLMKKIPVWYRRLEEQYIETQDDSSAKYELIYESTELFHTLLRVLNVFAGQERNSEAAIVLEVLEKVLPEDSLSEHIDFEAHARIHAGLVVVAEQIAQRSEEYTELKSKIDARSEMIFEKLESLSDVELKARILTGLFKGYILYSKEFYRVACELKDDEKKGVSLNCNDQFIKTLVGVALDFVEDPNQKLNGTIRTLSNIKSLEQRALLHFQLSDFAQMSGNFALHDEQMSIFTELTLSNIKNHGVSYVDYDDEGPAETLLSELEELIERDELEKAMDIARDIYKALFFVKLDEDLFLEDMEEPENDYDDEELTFFHPQKGIEEMKIRFMTLAASAGFLELAKDAYESCLLTTDSQDDRFELFMTYIKSFPMNDDAMSLS